MVTCNGLLWGGRDEIFFRRHGITTKKAKFHPKINRSAEGWGREYPIEATGGTGKGRGSTVPLSDGTETEATVRSSSGRPPPRLRPIFALILLLGVDENGHLLKIRESITNRTPETPPPAETAPQDLYKGGCRPVLATQGLVAPPIQPQIPERWEKGGESRPNLALTGSVPLRTDIPHPRQPAPSHGVVSKDALEAGGRPRTAPKGQTRTVAGFGLVPPKIGGFTCEGLVAIISPRNAEARPPTRLTRTNRHRRTRW